MNESSLYNFCIFVYLLEQFYLIILLVFEEKVRFSFALTVPAVARCVLVALGCWCLFTTITSPKVQGELIDPLIGRDINYIFGIEKIAHNY